MHMQRNEGYTILFGIRFCETLFDFAFVVGVIGLFVGAATYLTPNGDYNIYGWLTCSYLCGMSITLLWGAYETAKPRGDEKVETTDLQV